MTANKLEIKTRLIRKAVGIRQSATPFLTSQIPPARKAMLTHCQPVPLILENRALYCSLLRVSAMSWYWLSCVFNRSIGVAMEILSMVSATGRAPRNTQLKVVMKSGQPPFTPIGADHIVISSGNEIITTI